MCVRKGGGGNYFPITACTEREAGDSRDWRGRAERGPLRPHPFTPGWASRAEDARSPPSPLVHDNVSEAALETRFGPTNGGGLVRFGRHGEMTRWGGGGKRIRGGGGSTLEGGRVAFGASGRGQFLLTPISQKVDRRRRIYSPFVSSLNTWEVLPFRD